MSNPCIDGLIINLYNLYYVIYNLDIVRFVLIHVD